MTALEKAREQLSAREKEVADRLAQHRQLQNQLTRLESKLKELELSTHGDAGDPNGRKELRELTKKKIELELQVANARFDYEDAMDRKKAAEQELAEVERAAAVARLNELTRKRMELVEKINNTIDGLESDMDRYNTLAAEERRLADQLGMEYERGETETGPSLRLARILERHAPQTTKAAPVSPVARSNGERQPRPQDMAAVRQEARKQEKPASTPTPQAGGWWASVRKFFSSSGRVNSSLSKSTAGIRVRR